MKMQDLQEARYAGAFANFLQWVEKSVELLKAGNDHGEYDGTTYTYEYPAQQHQRIVDNLDKQFPDHNDTYLAWFVDECTILINKKTQAVTIDYIDDSLYDLGNEYER